MATDSSGNVFVVGKTNGSFDGQTNQGSDDGFITKFDGNGDKLWTKFIGGSNFDELSFIETNSIGNIFVGGSGQLYKLDSSGSILASASAGELRDMSVNGNYLYTRSTDYIGKFNTTDLSSVTSFSVPSSNYYNMILVDDNGYMYVNSSNNNGDVIYKLDSSGSIVAFIDRYAYNMFLKDGYLYIIYGQEIEKLNTSNLSVVSRYNNAYYGMGVVVDNSGNIFTAGTSCEDRQNCSIGNEVNFIMKVTQ